jgi:hypothetical protein
VGADKKALIPGEPLAEEARSRVADLIRREKAAGLSSAEASEPEHYQRLEHLMRLAKARAARCMSRE